MKRYVLLDLEGMICTFMLIFHIFSGQRVRTIGLLIMPTPTKLTCVPQV
jgi:hypothetical protein